MQVDLKTGLLQGVPFISSPNQDERPDPAAIELLVVHGISLPPGEFNNSGIVEFFCNQLNADAHPYYQTIADMKVSTHVLIRRSGEMIQFVPFYKRAWHAGESHYSGRDKCNDFSIGIELEGTDEIPYELIQYQQLTLLAQKLMLVYPKITVDRIVGHCEIAPTRKTDPGAAFDWNYFRQLLGNKS